MYGEIVTPQRLFLALKVEINDPSIHGYEMTKMVRNALSTNRPPYTCSQSVPIRPRYEVIKTDAK